MVNYHAGCKHSRRHFNTLDIAHWMAFGLRRATAAYMQRATYTALAPSAQPLLPTQDGIPATALPAPPPARLAACRLPDCAHTFYTGTSRRKRNNFTTCCVLSAAFSGLHAHIAPATSRTGRGLCGAATPTPAAPLLTHTCLLCAARLRTGLGCCAPPLAHAPFLRCTAFVTSSPCTPRHGALPCCYLSACSYALAPAHAPLAPRTYLPCLAHYHHIPPLPRHTFPPVSCLLHRRRGRRVGGVVQWRVAVHDQAGNDQPCGPEGSIVAERRLNAGTVPFGGIILDNVAALERHAHTRRASYRGQNCCCQRRHHTRPSPATTAQLPAPYGDATLHGDENNVLNMRVLLRYGHSVWAPYAGHGLQEGVGNTNTAGGISYRNVRSRRVPCNAWQRSTALAPYRCFAASPRPACQPGRSYLCLASRHHHLTF